MAEDRAQLVVDEELFLAAIDFLHGQSERHELLNVIGGFARTELVAARFKEAVGREIETDEQQAIEHYVSGVYLVAHHRANLEYVRQIIEETERPALDVIRLVAWAFLTAWSQRYGGTHAKWQVDGGTLIDPDA